MALLETVDRQCAVIEKMAGIICKQAEALEQARIAEDVLDGYRAEQKAVSRELDTLEAEMRSIG